MSVVLYVRVSPGLDPRPQVRRLYAYASAHGLTISRVFVDRAEPGLPRPAYQRLWRLISYGLVRSVLVWRLDRLANSSRHVIQLVGMFRTRGVRLISIHEPFDTASRTGQALARFHTVLTQVDHALQREAEANTARWARRGTHR